MDLRWVARAVGVVGPVVFTLTWLLLGAAHPGYSQRVETISALSGVGAPGRAVMIAAFAVLGVALAVTAVLAGGRLVGALIGLAAAGELVAGAFPVSCGNAAWCRPPAGPVATGVVHSLGAGTTFAALPLAMLATLWITRHAAARPDRWCAGLAVVVALPLLAWFLLCPGGLRGLAEKLFVTVLLAWTAWIAARARRDRPRIPAGSRY